MFLQNIVRDIRSKVSNKAGKINTCSRHQKALSAVANSRTPATEELVELTTTSTTQASITALTIDWLANTESCPIQSARKVVS